jgi:hypothetical protein
LLLISKDSSKKITRRKCPKSRNYGTIWERYSTCADLQLYVNDKLGLFVFLVRIQKFCPGSSISGKKEDYCFT